MHSSMKEHFYWNISLQQAETTPKFVTRPSQHYWKSTKKSTKWPKPHPTHPKPKNPNALTTLTSKTGKTNTTAPNTTKNAAARTRKDTTTKMKTKWTIMMKMIRWSMMTMMRMKKSQSHHPKREPSRWSWRSQMRTKSPRLSLGRWCIKTLLRRISCNTIRSFRKSNKLRMETHRISDLLYYMNLINESYWLKDIPNLLFVIHSVKWLIFN